MGLVWEIVITAVCVGGLMAGGWWLMGRLLRPIPAQAGQLVLLPGTGDGEGLEQWVRGHIWLRSLGLLNCPLVIADLGLSPEGRELALRLAVRWPGVVLWPVDDLPGYIRYH